MIGVYDPARLGLEFGRETVRLALGYAFDVLELHRVGLRVVAYNEQAIRCFRACGFVVEGRGRKAGLVGAERHHDVMIGVLARAVLLAE